MSVENSLNAAEKKRQAALCHARHYAKASQVKIANEAGISVSLLSRMLLGKRAVKEDEFVKLLNAVGGFIQDQVYCVTANGIAVKDAIVSVREVKDPELISITQTYGVEGKNKITFQIPRATNVGEYAERLLKAKKPAKKKSSK